MVCRVACAATPAASTTESSQTFIIAAHQETRSVVEGMSAAKRVFGCAVLSRAVVFGAALLMSAFPDFDTSQEHLLARAEGQPMFAEHHKPSNAQVHHQTKRWGI